MDYALLVRGLERLRNLLCDRQRLVHGYRTLADAVREREPLNELHGNRRRRVRALEAVDLCDVGMVQRGERFRLTLEPREPLVVVGNAVRQNLDGNLAR